MQLLLGKKSRWLYLKDPFNTALAPFTELKKEVIHSFIFISGLEYDAMQIAEKLFDVLKIAWSSLSEENIFKFKKVIILHNIFTSLKQFSCPLPKIRTEVPLSYQYWPTIYILICWKYTQMSCKNAEFDKFLCLHSPNIKSVLINKSFKWG